MDLAVTALRAHPEAKAKAEYAAVLVDRDEAPTDAPEVAMAPL